MKWVHTAAHVNHHRHTYTYTVKQKACEILQVRLIKLIIHSNFRQHDDLYGTDYEISK